MQPIPPLMIAVLALASACSESRPYCYEWNEAYSRGDAAQTAAAHQEWILAHLPEETLKSLKTEAGSINGATVATIDHLLMINCELHLTLPVATVLGDLITNYRAGRIDIFQK
jgi:hypothetical protein